MSVASADREEALFFVPLVARDFEERVLEDGDRFREVDPVLFDVEPFFFLVILIAGHLLSSISVYTKINLARILSQGKGSHFKA